MSLHALRRAQTVLTVASLLLGGLARSEPPRARRLPRVEKTRLASHSNPTPRALRRMSEPAGVPTQWGTLAFSSNIKQRSPSRAVQDAQVTAADRKALGRAIQSLDGQKLIESWGKLGRGKDARLVRLIVPEKHAQLAAMSEVLFPRVTERDRARLAWAQQEAFTTVMIPDYGKRPRVLVDTDRRVTYVLGSSYFGERKKSALRMWWREMKETRGAIPLHAAAMTVSFVDGSGSRKAHSTVVLGHSGTGKSTLSTSNEGLDLARGEKIVAHQDDAGALIPTARAGRWRFVGTEHGMFLKTEGVSPQSDPGAYEGMSTRGRVFFENVTLKDGKVDLLDTAASKNGRAVVDRRHTAMTRGQPLNMGQPDSIVMISRHELLPPIARVPRGAPEKGAFAYALGESVKTAAAGGNGEYIRETGFSSFIVGPPAKEANRMLDFLRAQGKRRSGGTQVFLMNTGHVRTADGLTKVQKSETLRLLRAMQRGEIEWRLDAGLGLEVPDAVKGMSAAELGRITVGRGMSAAEVERLSSSCRTERLQFLRSQVPGLDPSILAKGAY